MITTTPQHQFFPANFERSFFKGIYFTNYQKILEALNEIDVGVSRISQNYFQSSSNIYVAFIVIHIKISITEGRRTIRCKLTDETGLWLEI